MNDSIAPEERAVAIRYGLTDADYLAKKAQYAAKQGVSVAALSQLTTDDMTAINMLGQSSDTFQKQKLAHLAETIILKN